MRMLIEREPCDICGGGNAGIKDDDDYSIVEPLDFDNFQASEQYMCTACGGTGERYYNYDEVCDIVSDMVDALVMSMSKEACPVCGEHVMYNAFGCDDRILFRVSCGCVVGGVAETIAEAKGEYQSEMEKLNAQKS